MLLQVLALSVFQSISCLCADILVILPFPQYSHTMPFMPIFKELGIRGHNITILTPFEQKPNPKGFNQINLNFTSKDLRDVLWMAKGTDAITNLQRRRNFAFQLVGIWPLCEVVTPLVIQKVKPVLPPIGSKFDLIVTEPFFCMEPLVAAGILYNAPVIATLPQEIYPKIAQVTGNPQGFSYAPHHRLPFTGVMSFLQRVWNTIVGSVEVIGNNLYFFPRQDTWMRTLVDDPKLPYLGDLVRNVSLVLAETHFSLSYPRPINRNILEVGGVSIQLEKPLSKDLEKYMDEARDGVILFSWSSHFEAHGTEGVVTVMMEAFSKLKQRVIFKWFHSNISNVPDNVLVQTWVPQPSVLAHKNTVLFISHGGLNSLFEAAYYGVPVLGTPLFADQFYNIRILENKGMAVEVDVSTIQDGIAFPNAMNRLLSEPRYMEKAKKQSRILRDRPMGVVEEAVYWIEYILRHGSDHLQPKSKWMPWYQLHLIDVWLFIMALLLVPVLLLCWAARFCLSKCWKKPQGPVSIKKKKN